jgi:hypothetical protein
MICSEAATAAGYRDVTDRVTAGVGRGVAQQQEERKHRRMTRIQRPTATKSTATLYNGQRYRTREAARWAVLLTELGLRFEYERRMHDPAPFSVYWPTFWLPELEVWLDICSGAPMADDYLRMAALTLTPQQWFGCVLYGPPRAEHSGRVFWMGKDCGRPTAVQCTACGAVGFDTLGSEPGTMRVRRLRRSSSCTHEATVEANTPAIQAAVLAARRARFPRGDRPERQVWP